MKMKIGRPGFLNKTVLTKVLLIMALDVIATTVSFFLGLWFRYDFSFQDIRAVEGELFSSVVFEEYDEQYMYFFAIALILLVLEMLVGERRNTRKLFN